jgi:hypothetical protein
VTAPGWFARLRLLRAPPLKLPPPPGECAEGRCRLTLPRADGAAWCLVHDRIYRPEATVTPTR